MDKQMTGPTRRTTIHDVAALAGVSSMTVSRVATGHPNVKAETRARVRAAMETLDFTPNSAARRLAASDLMRVALVYANPSAAYMSALLVGMTEACGEAGDQLVLQNCGGMDGAFEAEAFDRLLRRVDAVVLSPPLCERDDMLARARASGRPVAALAPGLAAAGAVSVRIDNEAAARAMAQHLTALGHRRFGFICGAPDQTASALRLDGFRKGLREAGVDALVTAEGAFDFRSGLAAAERLLSCDPRPTAIFAANDDMAAATVNAALRRGLRLPEELSIAGFDDTLIATSSAPALTTIRQPLAEMARCAIETLRAAKFTEPQADRDLILPFELVLRDSTAAAS